MPEKLIRTLGASAILVALSVVAVMELTRPDEPTAVEIVEEAGKPTAGPVSTQESSSTTQPVQPFVYRVGLLGLPTTSNFWAYFGSAPTVWDAYVLGPSKGSLFRLDQGGQALAPELATELSSPTWNGDGWHVVVELSQDSYWSDGTAISAADFAFTFDTVRSLDLGGQWGKVFPATVTSVVAVDEHTIDIAFADRPSLDVWPYGVGTAPIMAAHYWDSALDEGIDLAGLYAMDGIDDPASGPLRLIEISEDRVVSGSNPGYSPHAPDIVEYIAFSSVEALGAALGDGEISTMLSPRGLTVDEAATLDLVDGIETLTSPGFGIRYLSFNIERAPMADLEFRTAVALLLDRETLGATVAAASPARTLLPEAVTAWYDDDRAAQITAPFEVERAVAVDQAVAGLESVGYTWSTKPSWGENGFESGEGLRIDGQTPAALTVLTTGDSYDPGRRLYAEEVSRTIEALGFEVIPVTTDFDTVIDLTFTPDEEGSLRYDMALLGWSLGNPGLPSFYEDLFRSDSPANNTGYTNPEMDRLIDLYRSASDLESARKVLWEMEALLAQDLPYLPLYASQIHEAYRSDSIAFSEVPGLGGIQGTAGALHLVSEVE